MDDKKIWAFIFARGGSKGIPDKNIQDLNGIPLVAHSIKLAKSIGCIDRVILSTDCDKIANVGKDYGAEVPFIRPNELATDTAGELDAWKHAIRSIDETFDVFVSLPPTSPLRSGEDVLNCIDVLLSSDTDIVTTITEASRSPYFNMVKRDDEGYSHIALTDQNGKKYVRRQDAPILYDMTTVAYATTPTYVLNCESLFDGKMRSVEIPTARAVDIDTPLDLDFARYITGQKKHEIN